MTRLDANMGEPNMTPEEEAAWVSMARDGSLSRVVTGMGTSQYEAALARRMRLLAKGRDFLSMKEEARDGTP